jgi:Trk K+ transport system NAD-binding subunit
MNIVVAGAGTVGMQIAAALADADNAVVLVGADPRRVAQLADRGLTVITGDAGVTATLEEAGGLRADVLVEEATGSARTVRLAELPAVGIVLAEATVSATSAVRGRPVAKLGLAHGDLVVAVVRHGRSIPAAAARQLRDGDRVLVLTPLDGKARVHHAFYPEDPGRDVDAEGTAAGDPEAGMDGVGPTAAGPGAREAGVEG